MLSGCRLNIHQYNYCVKYVDDLSSRCHVLPVCQNTSKYTILVRSPSQCGCSHHTPFFRYIYFHRPFSFHSNCVVLCSLHFLFFTYGFFLWIHLFDEFFRVTSLSWFFSISSLRLFSFTIRASFIIPIRKKSTNEQSFSICRNIIFPMLEIVTTARVFFIYSMRLCALSVAIGSKSRKKQKPSPTPQQHSLWMVQ